MFRGWLSHVAIAISLFLCLSQKSLLSLIIVMLLTIDAIRYWMNKEPKVDIVSYQKEMRHNFLNRLQIISAMVQVGKPEEKIVEYIKETSFSFRSLGNLYNMDNTPLAVQVAGNIMQLIMADYRVNINVGLKQVVTHIDFERLQAIMDEVVAFLCEAAEMLSYDDRQLEITIEQRARGETLTFELPYWAFAISDGVEGSKLSRKIHKLTKKLAHNSAANVKFEQALGLQIDIVFSQLNVSTVPIKMLG